MGRLCHLPKSPSLCPGTAWMQSEPHCPPGPLLPVPFSRTTVLCVPSVSPVQRVAKG